MHFTTGCEKLEETLWNQDSQQKSLGQQILSFHAFCVNKCVFVLLGLCMQMLTLTNTTITEQNTCVYLCVCACMCAHVCAYMWRPEVAVRGLTQ